jgi:hypothetical protein
MVLEINEYVLSLIAVLVAAVQLARVASKK